MCGPSAADLDDEPLSGPPLPTVNPLPWEPGRPDDAGARPASGEPAGLSAVPDVPDFILVGKRLPPSLRGLRLRAAYQALAAEAKAQLLAMLKHL